MAYIYSFYFPFRSTIYLPTRPGSDFTKWRAIEPIIRFLYWEMTTKRVWFIFRTGSTAAMSLSVFTRELHPRV